MKKISILWFLYIVIINSYLLILDFFNLIQVKSNSIKEICFALWGYGWDGMHYIKIATQGYEYPLQAFFPLYPLLIKLINIFLPLTLSYRINLVLLLFVLLISYKLLDYIKVNKNNKIKILILFLSFPTAFFLQANYVECLYILLSSLGLIYLLEKKYIEASIFAGFLSALKISGVSLGLVILISYVIDNKDSLKRINKDIINHLLNIAVITVISLSGFIGYMNYLDKEFGSYNIFFKSQKEWGREVLINNNDNLFQGYYAHFLKALNKPDLTLFRRFSELFAFILTTYLLIISKNKLRKELWLFSLLQILIPISSGTFLSLNRLILLAYPLLFYGFSLIVDRKKIFFPILTLFLILQFVGIYLFFNNIFVG